MRVPSLRSACMVCLLWMPVVGLGLSGCGSNQNDAGDTVAEDGSAGDHRPVGEDQVGDAPEDHWTLTDADTTQADLAADGLTADAGDGLLPDAAPLDGHEGDVLEMDDQSALQDTLGETVDQSDQIQDTLSPDLTDGGSSELPDLEDQTEVAADTTPLAPYVLMVSPASGSKVLAGAAVDFEGQTNCLPASVEFWADGQYLFGSFETDTANFSYSYAFNTPGVDREIRVEVQGPEGCAASDTLYLTVQAAYQVGSEVRSDSNGNSFTVHWARFPTADTSHSLVIAGSTSAKTVQNHAGSVANAKVAINGGYFAFGQGPVSYAKGSLGYESPSGNVKGPRGCFWYDDITREAGVEVSMGREYVGGSWGDGLFPDATDVVCAGPVLVRDGDDVFDQQFDAENFGSSGISPDSPLPRTAICIQADGSVLLLTAQHDTVKARGFTLPELTSYLIQKQCVQALNLDGGGSTAFWSLTPSGYWPGTEDRAVYNVGVLR